MVGIGAGRFNIGSNEIGVVFLDEGFSRRFRALRPTIFRIFEGWKSVNRSNDDIWPFRSEFEVKVRAETE